VKLALQVAVQIVPAVLLLAQLKVALGGLVGGLVHVGAAAAAAVMLESDAAEVALGDDSTCGWPSCVLSASGVFTAAAGSVSSCGATGAGSLGLAAGTAGPAAGVGSGVASVAGTGELVTTDSRSSSNSSKRDREGRQAGMQGQLVSGLVLRPAVGFNKVLQSSSQYACSLEAFNCQVGQTKALVLYRPNTYVTLLPYVS
jgi:hypothetical protein